MWYAGIDWADQHHDAVVIDEAGKRIGTTHVAHSAEGLDTLVTFLKGLGDVADHPICIRLRNEEGSHFGIIRV